MSAKESRKQELRVFIELCRLSDWGSVDEDDLETWWEQVASGEMPPWFYIFPMHPVAKLSASDKTRLKSYFLRGAEPPKATGPTRVSASKM